MASYADSSVQFFANGRETARGPKRNFPVSVNALISATIAKVAGLRSVAVYETSFRPGLGHLRFARNPHRIDAKCGEHFLQADYASE
jgi:hypothetical protein